LLERTNAQLQRYDLTGCSIYQRNASTAEQLHAQMRRLTDPDTAGSMAIRSFSRQQAPSRDDCKRGEMLISSGQGRLQT
jgi:hypothetical protein